MNGIVCRAGKRAELIHGLAKNVHHAAKSGAADGHFDGLAEVLRLHAAHEALGGLHGDGADAAFAKVLLHFSGYVNRSGNVKPFAGDVHVIVNSRKMTRFKLNVEHRTDDLYDVTCCSELLCHFELL